MVTFVLPEDASETLFELFAFEPLRYYASNVLEGPSAGRRAGRHLDVRDLPRSSTSI